MKSNFIAGVWQEGGGAVFSSENPANGEVLWAARAAAPADVGAAVEAAAQAFEDWSMRPPAERAGYLEAFRGLLIRDADRLRDAISAETGKARWDAAGEVKAMQGKLAVTLAAYDERTPSRAGEQGAMTARLQHRPHGVMAVFGPYNFPGHLPNGHIMPALLAGNTVVFKPSEQTPYVGALMTELWAEAGLPDGVFNLVQGARESGAALVAHPSVRGVLFTGSVPTGRAIASALADRPEVMLALELGGNNPLIVHDVADARAAALVTINSAYITSGQRCTCARRLIVTESATGDAFLDTLTEAMRAIRVGDPAADPEPYMGPVISTKAAEHVLAAQAALISAGGNPLVPCERLAAGPAFVSPGLVDVTTVPDVADEEIFGPLLQLYRVPDLAAATARAADTRYGLAAALLSDDRAAYDYFYPRARAGIVNWNQQTTGASSAAPFGGIGLSGNFRPSAYYAADYVAYPVASIEPGSAGPLAAPAVPTGIVL